MRQANIPNFLNKFIFIVLALLLPGLSLASSTTAAPFDLNMTDSIYGYLALAIFFIAYLFVMTEEISHVRKSKPVVLAAGIIWFVIALISHGNKLYVTEVNAAVRHNILEFAELFLFLLVAMTYVNAMEERRVFDALRAWLVRKGYGYRQLFWVTGILAFCISPVADNLTTALLMCAVVMAVGGENNKFVTLGCINIVVAANAGGAFSPFGDITTLMVWQKGMLGFFDFGHIFLPSVVSYVIPAAIMHFAVPDEKPAPSNEEVKMKFGAKRIMVLFLLTIFTAVCFHNSLHLPPVLGMMTGLGYLMFASYFIKRRDVSGWQPALSSEEEFVPFDIFNKVKRAEWDTLFFFYGIILCVGGLATFGYLEVISHAIYNGWAVGLPEIHKATPANSFVGILSAIIDNIPVMFAVLTMNPSMSQGQWLLVTLTAGIGGSMLSIGSAAGVALMGQSRGKYTFMGHLKWTWAIFLGYVAAIGCHLWLNHSFLFKPILKH
jgi:NhaD family Na+/H+ antiporter